MVTVFESVVAQPWGGGEEVGGILRCKKQKEGTQKAEEGGLGKGAKVEVTVGQHECDQPSDICKMLSGAGGRLRREWRRHKTLGFPGRWRPRLVKLRMCRDVQAKAQIKVNSQAIGQPPSAAPFSSPRRIPANTPFDSIVTFPCI